MIFAVCDRSWCGRRLLIPTPCTKGWLIRFYYEYEIHSVPTLVAGSAYVFGFLFYICPHDFYQDSLIDAVIESRHLQVLLVTTIHPAWKCPAGVCDRSE
jgi:hypothetical protein